MGGALLTIRNAQMHTLGQAKLQTFRDQLLAMLRHDIAQDVRSPQAGAGLPAGYLEALVDHSIAICRECGHDQQGTIADVMHALWKDDAHPLDGARRARKTDAVLADLRTRTLFVQTQAVNAALERAASARE